MMRAYSGLLTVLLKAREERQLERRLKHLQRQDLLVLDELGYPAVM
jgi:DNA replication protein DnaC